MVYGSNPSSSLLTSRRAFAGPCRPSLSSFPCPHPHHPAKADKLHFNLNCPAARELASEAAPVLTIDVLLFQRWSKHPLAALQREAMWMHEFGLPHIQLACTNWSTQGFKSPRINPQDSCLVGNFLRKNSQASSQHARWIENVGSYHWANCQRKGTMTMYLWGLSPVLRPLQSTPQAEAVVLVLLLLVLHGLCERHPGQLVFGLVF